MPRIIAKPDNLDERNREFDQSPLTSHVFLNSVPKCGSHLLKNIVRMFVPVEQQYGPDFIQFPTLKQHHRVFIDPTSKLSWGHLLFADSSAALLKSVKHVLLVRDPYDWVLARARFFLSDNFQGNLEHLKNGSVNTDDFINMMIFGIHNKVPNLSEIFLNNAVAWLGTSVKLVRYEQIVGELKRLDSQESHIFFEDLLGFLDIELPDDWRERIKIGSDREQSGTARENLDMGGADVPEELSVIQKRLVDYAAPGLREILGYT